MLSQKPVEFLQRVFRGDGAHLHPPAAQVRQSLGGDCHATEVSGADHQDCRRVEQDFCQVLRNQAMSIRAPPGRVHPVGIDDEA